MRRSDCSGVRDEGCAAPESFLSLMTVMKTYRNRKLTADPAPNEKNRARDENVVKNGFWRKVLSTLGRVPFTEDAVAAYYCATDRRTPASVRAILMGAIAYFVVPVDAVPDFIAGLGFTDDAAVLMMAFSAIRGHLRSEHRSRARSFLDGIKAPEGRQGGRQDDLSGETR